MAVRHWLRLKSDAFRGILPGGAFCQYPDVWYKCRHSGSLSDKAGNEIHDRNGR